MYARLLTVGDRFCLYSQVQVALSRLIQVAVQTGLPYTALRDMIFAHPTMAEGLSDLFA